MEIVQGIVDAAKRNNPLLSCKYSAGARKYAKHIYLVKLVEAALEDKAIYQSLFTLITAIPSKSVKTV